VLFLRTFRCSNLHKIAIAIGDIYLFGVELTLDVAIYFKDLELIIDHFDNLHLSPRGRTPAT
jgi:hypothetical protein